MAKRNSRFWTGGREACRDGLKKEYRATVAKLQKKLQKAESEEERHRIADKLEQVEQICKERLGRVDENVF